MMYLTLNTNQTNCLKSKNELIWTLPNLDLSCYSSVGLSSLMVDFSSRNDKIVPVTTDLIDKNSLNPSGLIHVIPGEETFIEHSRSCEKWPLDSIRPRYISFKFENSSVNIEYCKITLVFTTERDAT